MTTSGTFDLRIMTEADIPDGIRLCTLAGWNQTDLDWRRFLRLQPCGCFVAARDGKVHGTVTTLSYEKRFGWIGMVLVDPEIRKQGLGTRLLERGMDYLRSEGVETLKLDATPMGHGLYLRLGFLDEYEIERWEISSAAAAGAPQIPLMSAGSLEDACRLDRDIFGADRSSLLRSLWEENPFSTAAVYAGGRLTGYAFGRRGRRAHYLGPWVAESAPAARALLEEFLARLRGAPVFLDVCLRNSSAREVVERAGFQFQRKLTRMHLGPNCHPGTPEKVFGIAGPELG